MNQDELTTVLVWVFSVGIPAGIAAIARIMRRQNENRANIAQQEVKTEVIQHETDRRFEDLISTLGVLQNKIDDLDDQVINLKSDNAALTRKHAELQAQLDQKEKELKAQIEHNQKVTSQLEDERQSHAGLGTKYSELEERYTALERRVADMNLQMEKQAAIIETYNRIIPLINNLPMQDKRATTDVKKAVGE